LTGANGSSSPVPPLLPAGFPMLHHSCCTDQDPQNLGVQEIRRLPQYNSIVTQKGVKINGGITVFFNNKYRILWVEYPCFEAYLCEIIFSSSVIMRRIPEKTVLT
jgi:hypothetical protein